MPSALNNVLYPLSFEPWYVTRVELADAPGTGDKFDIIVPNATGKFTREVTADGPVLTTGYMIALEAFKAGDTSIQAAMPGSSVPHVISGAGNPGTLVKLVYAAADGQRCAPASAADFAAGKAFGRIRRRANIGGVDTKTQGLYAEDNLVEVLTF